MDHHETTPNDDLSLQRIRAKLVRLMLVSIFITVVLVGLVLAAVIYKIMVPIQSANMELALEQQIEWLPDGQLVSYQLSGNVVVLHRRHPITGDELIFYDYRLQQVISRLRLIQSVKDDG